jgi:hypothetical protein
MLRVLVLLDLEGECNLLGKLLVVYANCSSAEDSDLLLVMVACVKQD